MGAWFSGRIAVSKTADGSSILSAPAMILKIRKFNEKVLRKKAEPVEKIDGEIKKLVFDMVETMKVNDGVGLAAPQVGVSKRVIVVQGNPLINPKILKKKGVMLFAEEGCLSFPNIYIEIKRFDEIEIEALDIEGKKIELEAKGLLARVIQHEIDHIDGILFFNRLGLIEKIKFKLKHLSLKF